MPTEHPENLEYPTEAYFAPGWSPPRRRSRRTRVVAIVVIAAMVLIGGGAVVLSNVLASAASRPLSAAVTKPRSAQAVQLVTGHCLASLPDDGPVGRVRVVPCSQAHVAQVITEYAFATDAVWPGQDEADARVGRACELTAAQVAAGVRTVTWAPSKASWQDGDRTGLCLAVTAAPVTGSLLDGTAQLT